MTSDEMIADLREAFARRATDITGDSATSVAQRVRVRPDTRRLDAVGIAALSIAVTALTVIGFLAVNTDRKPIPAAKSRPPVGSMASDQGDRIHLAGYDLTLPRAYAVATDRCLPELAGPYVPVGSSEFFAKSAAGGCLEVVMVPGSAKPRDAVPVAIGRRQGFVATTADLIMLYVPLPTSDYRFLLLMSDRSTSQEQLISIANGGLKFD